MQSAEASARYLDTLFKLSGGGRRGVSPQDVFYAAMLPEPAYSPQIAANIVAALGYAEYFGGLLRLTDQGRSYCKSMRASRM